MRAPVALRQNTVKGCGNFPRSCHACQRGPIGQPAIRGELDASSPTAEDVTQQVRLPHPSPCVNAYSHLLLYTLTPFVDGCVGVEKNFASDTVPAFAAISFGCPNHNRLCDEIDASHITSLDVPALRHHAGVVFYCDMSRCVAPAWTVDGVKSQSSAAIARYGRPICMMSYRWQASLTFPPPRAVHKETLVGRVNRHTCSFFQPQDSIRSTSIFRDILLLRARKPASKLFSSATTEFLARRTAAAIMPEPACSNALSASRRQMTLVATALSRTASLASPEVLLCRPFRRSYSNIVRTSPACVSACKNSTAIDTQPSGERQIAGPARMPGSHRTRIAPDECRFQRDVPVNASRASGSAVGG